MHGKFLSSEDRQQLRQRRMAFASAMRWVAGILLTAVILLNLFTYVIQIVHYNGNGMSPTIRDGQTLVMLKTRDVESGDIIAFYYNNQVLVRRVICTGGSRISIQGDGTVLVNDAELEEPYLQTKSLGQCNTAFPCHVRSGYVFVMGDNREVAMDSRLTEIGNIPEARIIGKVLFVI